MSFSNGSSMNAFLPPKWVPHDYQERGVRWLVTHPEGALFLWPGLGKTSTTLAAMLKLHALGYKHRMLVIAPLRVCQATWLAEPRKWAQFSHLKVGLAHGPNKKEVLMDPQYDIVVLNYDGIVWASTLLTKRNPFGIVVFDELTKMKHSTTRRFKAIKLILDQFQFRWGLTGTPAANTLMDLFGQILCLDLGYRFGKYITHYKAKYFHQKPYDPWGWHITAEKAERIHAQVSDLAMYVDPEEVLQLPPLMHVDIEVTLPPAVMKQYKELKLLSIMQLTEEKVITAVNAGVATSKLRQLVGGAVYSDDGVEEVHSAKLDALEDLVEELAGEPLLVAYAFTHELERIQKRFPKVLAIKGGMSSKAVAEVLSAWDNGEAPILCVQPQAAAHGLNLQTGGSKLCWFAQTYNLEEYSQLIARLHRQGQVSTVMVYHILAAGTLDKHIREVLNGKNATQEALFSALLK